jgi:hypothetical protein
MIVSMKKDFFITIDGIERYGDCEISVAEIDHSFKHEFGIEECFEMYINEISNINIYDDDGNIINIEITEEIKELIMEEVHIQ